MRVLPSLAAGAAVLMVASGCGLTEEQTRPGLAAEVGDRTLDLRTLDDTVTEYCEAIVDVDGAPTKPLAVVRSEIAVGWVQAAAIAELAEDYGVEVPDEIDRLKVERAWEEVLGDELTDDNLKEFELLTWMNEVISVTVAQLGSADLSQNGGSAVTNEQAAEHGFALMGEWITDNEPVFNPIFGEFDLKTGLFSDAGSLSVAVSDEAAAGGPKAQVDPRQLAALPPSQVCGPPVAADQPPLA